MDGSHSVTKYLSRRNVIPIGRRLSLFPPRVKKGRKYIMISSLPYQYISKGVSSLLVGSGTSIFTLIRFANKLGIYPEIVSFPNLYNSIGGLYRDGLIIGLTKDSVRPCHMKFLGRNEKRPFYLDFLIRFNDNPIYFAYDVKTDSLDELRALLKLSREYIGEGGAQIIYMSKDGYRFRLVVQKKYRKHILESLSSIDVEYTDVNYLDSYSGILSLDELRVDWGRFYLLLFKGDEPGPLLSDNKNLFIYFGDSHKKIYVVISKGPIKDPVPDRVIYFNEGQLSVIK